MIETILAIMLAGAQSGSLHVQYQWPGEAYPPNYGGPRIYSTPRGGPMMPVPREPPPRYVPPVGRGDMPMPNYAPNPPYYQEYRRYRDCDPRAPGC